MLPGHEAPRAGADGLFAEVGAGGRRRDRCHGHREQLGEDGQRLFECDDQGGVVCGDDADQFALAVGNVARAPDREQRPDGTALRAGVEYAQEGGRNMTGDEARSIGVGHAASQMKRVRDAVTAHFPSLGEPRFDFRVGRESRQSVEQVGDGAARRDVGGMRRIEGARVIPIARVDQRMPIR